LTCFRLAYARAFCLPSSSGHVKHAVPDEQPCAQYSRSSVSASMHGEGKAPGASHLLCVSSPWGRVSHKHYKSRDKDWISLLKKKWKFGDEQLHPEGCCCGAQGKSKSTQYR